MDISRLSVPSPTILPALGGPVLALTADAINTATFTADAAKEASPARGDAWAGEPSQVSKSSPHGGVRLTNCGATERAGLLKPGVQVRFVDQTGS